MWQALELNPNDYVDAETIAREARNFSGHSTLARPGGSQIWQPEVDSRVALLSTSARPSGSTFGTQPR